MKTTALLAVPVFLFMTAAPAREASPRTILDYYLTLAADSQFGPRDGSHAQRLADLEQKDVRHGYLRWPTTEAASTEMKLFRLSDRTPLLALAHTGCCCEGTCVRRLRFLADREGGLVDVTQEVWTDLTVDDKRQAIEQRLKPKDRWMAGRMADMAVYRLPRTSAAIFVEADGRAYLRFRLRGDKFVRY
jgi:hypothetical protein